MKKFGDIKNLMYLLGEQNFRNGFPYYNQNYRKRRLLFNIIIRNSFNVFVLTKEFISYYITDDYLSVLIGDWFHQFIFKFQMTLSMAIVVLINILCDINNEFF